MLYFCWWYQQTNKIPCSRRWSSHYIISPATTASDRRNRICLTSLTTAWRAYRSLSQIHFHTFYWLYRNSLSHSTKCHIILYARNYGWLETILKWFLHASTDPAVYDMAITVITCEHYTLHRLIALLRSCQQVSRSGSWPCNVKDRDNSRRVDTPWPVTVLQDFNNVLNIL